MRGNAVAVLGTGTGVGKTFVTAVLALALRRGGIRVGVCKPVASGGRRRGSRYVSTDAIWLKRVLGLEERVEEINPVCFRRSLAPSVAAQLEGRRLSPGTIRAGLERAMRRHRSVLVEGVGGVLVPLLRGFSVADLVAEMDMPAVVVGLAGLGTVNHSLMTIEVLRARRIRVLGVVLNGARGEDASEAHNARCIREESGVKVLAVLPRLKRRRVPDLERIAGRVRTSGVSALLRGIRRNK